MAAAPMTQQQRAPLSYFWPDAQQDGAREAVLALSRLALAFALLLFVFQQWSGGVALACVAALGAGAAYGFGCGAPPPPRPQPFLPTPSAEPVLYTVGENAADSARPSYRDMRRDPHHDSVVSPLADWAGPGLPGPPEADQSCRVGGWLPLEPGQRAPTGATDALRLQLSAFNDAVCGHRNALMQSYLASPEHAMKGAHGYGSAYGPPGQSTRGGGGTTRFYQG